MHHSKSIMMKQLCNERKKKKRIWQNVLRKKKVYLPLVPMYTSHIILSFSSQELGSIEQLTKTQKEKAREGKQKPAGMRNCWGTAAKA